jgi:aminoglycoside 6'-N-acetyltransferase I
MNVQRELLPEQRANILQNLYPAYLHDLSAYMTALPNPHGLFEEETVERYNPETFLKVWWQHPQQLFPFLITADNLPAGFALVYTQPYTEDETQFCIAEFFILHPYRRTGAAEAAARQVFDRFHGTWKAEVLPLNLPAQKFWRRVIANYSGGAYTEGLETGHEGGMLVFRFEN